METGYNREQWWTHLSCIGEHLANEKLTANLVLIGSVPNILSGQPARTTVDLDVWAASSKYDAGALRSAAVKSGLEFDPKGELEPDKPYLQVVRPGIVQVGAFEPLLVDVFGGLTIYQPPAENLVASKLLRATPKDVEDIAWMMGQYRPDPKKIRSVVDSFTLPNRRIATENLVYLDCFSNDDTPASIGIHKNPPSVARKPGRTR